MTKTRNFFFFSTRFFSPCQRQLYFESLLIFLPQIPLADRKQTNKQTKLAFWYKVKEIFLLPQTLSVYRLKLFTTQSRLLTALEKEYFENIAGKGENAGNQHFLLFPQCFLPIPERNSVFQLQLMCCLQILSIWTSRKFCRLLKSQ